MGRNRCGVTRRDYGIEIVEGVGIIGIVRIGDILDVTIVSC